MTTFKMLILGVIEGRLCCRLSARCRDLPFSYRRVTAKQKATVRRRRSNFASMHSDHATAFMTTPPVNNFGLTNGPTLKRCSKTDECTFKQHRHRLRVCSRHVKHERWFAPHATLLRQFTSQSKCREKAEAGF